MKVNYVVQRYGEEVPGGAEGACRRLAEGVAAAGYEVNVLTTCALDSETWANHFPPGESESNGVRVIRLQNASNRHPRFEALSNKIRWDPDPSRDLQNEWVKRQGPESPALIEEIKSRAEISDLWVFYTYLYYPTLVGLPIVGEKALLHPALHDEWQARLPIVRETIRCSAALSMQTPEEWEWTVRFAGWPPSKVRMIGMGVDEGHGDTNALRKKFALGSDPFVLYLGRVDKGKGAHDLVRDFIRFKQGHLGPLKLFMAGDVRHEPPMHDDVVVAGPVSNDERWAAFQACEAYLHPSPVESFGIALLEAWTHSKPALVNSRCDVTRGHALRSRGGIPYGDGFEFDAALELVLDDQEVARTLGQNGRVYAEQYLWPRVHERYIAYLEELAEALS